MVVIGYNTSVKWSVKHSEVRNGDKKQHELAGESEAGSAGRQNENIHDNIPGQSHPSTITGSQEDATQ